MSQNGHTHFKNLAAFAVCHFETFFIKSLSCTGERALNIFLVDSHSMSKCHANECFFSICGSFESINLKVAFGS